MKELTDILLAAIGANDELVEETHNRVYDTCIPVPPFDKDNTPLPYIVVYDEGAQNDLETKDYVWEGDIDHVKVAVEIGADTPDEVRQLRNKVRRAIEAYIVSNAEEGKDVPALSSSTYNGVQWDYSKPCYYDTLHYQCDVTIQDDEQES